MASKKRRHQEAGYTNHNQRPCSGMLYADKGRNWKAGDKLDNILSDVSPEDDVKIM